MMFSTKYQDNDIDIGRVRSYIPQAGGSDIANVTILMANI